MQMGKPDEEKRNEVGGEREKQIIHRLIRL
jgi:hypothetical protein